MFYKTTARPFIDCIDCVQHRPLVCFVNNMLVVNGSTVTNVMIFY